MSSAPLPRRLKLAKALGRQNSRTRWLEVNRPPAGGDDQVPELLYLPTAGHDVLQAGSTTDGYTSSPTEGASMILRSDGWMGFQEGTTNIGQLVPESAVVRGPPAFYGTMLGPGPGSFNGISVTQDQASPVTADFWVYSGIVDPQTDTTDLTKANAGQLAGLVRLQAGGGPAGFPAIGQPIAYVNVADYNVDSEGQVFISVDVSGFHTANGFVGISGDDAGAEAINSGWTGAGAPTDGMGHFTDVFVLYMDSHWTSGLGFGVWGHAAPGSQPATPVTLGDVIAVLQSYGMCA